MELMHVRTHSAFDNLSAILMSSCRIDSPQIEVGSRCRWSCFEDETGADRQAGHHACRHKEMEKYINDRRQEAKSAEPAASGKGKAKGGPAKGFKS